MKPPQRFIYVIGPLTGAQKVGLTTDPKARLATLQTGCPHDLVLHVAVRVPFGEAHAIERRAHRILAGCCARNEWFSTSPAEAMAAVLEAGKLSSPEAPLRVSRPPVLDNPLPLFAFQAPGIPAVLVAPARRRLWEVCRSAIGRG